MYFVVDPRSDATFTVVRAEVDHSAGSVAYFESQVLTTEQLLSFIAARETATCGGGTEPVQGPSTDSAVKTKADQGEESEAAQEHESQAPRWVWPDTSITYAQLHALGTRVQRCHDLRLSRAILRNSQWISTNFTPAPGLAPDAARELGAWDRPPQEPSDALFTVTPPVLGDAQAEFARQMAALAAARPEATARQPYLLAAESAGALIAVEMTAAGVPWRAQIHDSLLAAELGPRPPVGHRPEKLEELAVRVRELLDAPDLNPDSPKDLLATLQRAGFAVTSTSKWEIRDIKHPAVPVLLDYKKRARMLSATGWVWMDQWIKDDRFRPVYVPGGAATGRWGADGGGALQLPHFIRPAVVADPGWTFVISDAAQLEPRILAAMSMDAALIAAGQGHDLYEGLKRAAGIDSRDHAKVGMLGAMYGGTTGISAQVLPKFKVAFPQAMALLESAASTGEQGGRVHTWLGRTSAPSNFGAALEGEDPKVSQDRRQRTRAYGRFTRNFIVQGSAAEWALVWMALVRQELFALTLAEGGRATTDGPHLVFFLHDEILVHTPARLAKQVAQIVRESAATAAKLLYGDTGVEFPVSAHINTVYLEPEDTLET